MTHTENLPNVHTNDPITSREAAQLMEEAGLRSRHVWITLQIVRRHPGKTAVELWELATEAEKAELKEMQEVRRRLTDLTKWQGIGFVFQGAKRRCSIKKTSMVTWEPCSGLTDPPVVFAAKVDPETSRAFVDAFEASEVERQRQ